MGKRRNERISELCRKSLEEKWHEGSDRFALTADPFCWDAKQRNGGKYDGNRCNVCLCPPEICNGEGEFGYQGEIRDWISEQELIDREVGGIPGEMLDHMIGLLNKYVIKDKLDVFWK